MYGMLLESVQHFVQVRYVKIQVHCCVLLKAATKCVSLIRYSHTIQGEDLSDTHPGYNLFIVDLDKF